MTEEVLSEIAQILTGTQDKAPDSAEGRTDPEQSLEREDVPLAAEASEPKQDAVSSEEPEGEPEPLNMKGLAEKLGTSPAKLYRDVELIPGLTLGQAKDRAKDLLEGDGMLASVEERRIATTNEIEQQRHDAQLALSLPDMTPEQRQAAYGAYTEQQNTLAVKTIEGWDEPGTREAELTEISALLQEYDVPQARANNTVDALELRILADYNRLRKRVSKAKDSVVKPKPDKQLSTRKRPVSKSANAKIEADFESGKISRNDAITALIANG
jgi:hypothetical protein